jgi:hypothetical protein
LCVVCATCGVCVWRHSTREVAVSRALSRRGRGCIPAQQAAAGWCLVSDGRVSHTAVRGPSTRMLRCADRPLPPPPPARAPPGSTPQSPATGTAALPRSRLQQTPP